MHYLVAIEETCTYTLVVEAGTEEEAKGIAEERAIDNIEHIQVGLFKTFTVDDRQVNVIKPVEVPVYPKQCHVCQVSLDPEDPQSEAPGRGNSGLCRTCDEEEDAYILARRGEPR